MYSTHTCILLAAISIAGCEPDPTPESRPNRGLVGVLWALAIQPDGDTLVPDDPVGDECDNCNGTGQIGDGRTMMKCLECDGTGRRTNGSGQEATGGSTDTVPGAADFSWTEFEEARTLGVPTLVYVGGPPGCAPCARTKAAMEDPRVQHVMGEYVCVRLPYSAAPTWDVKANSFILVDEDWIIPAGGRASCPTTSGELLDFFEELRDEFELQNGDSSDGGDVVGVERDTPYP